MDRLADAEGILKKSRTVPKPAGHSEATAAAMLSSVEITYPLRGG